MSDLIRHVEMWTKSVILENQKIISFDKKENK